MKNKNIIANILVLLFGYLGMIFLSFFDKYFNFQVFHQQFYLGTIIIVIGITIRLFATIEFSKNNVGVLEMNSHPNLVTSGIYKYSRNPLYVGILLVTLGFILNAGSFTGLLLEVLFFIFWNLLIKFKEEPDLKKQFGTAFDNYKLKVNRWI